jgi:ribonuclease E
MPNTAHGGGISRKISNPADRKRLKQVMADLHLPNGMGAIVRTAGLKRSAADIRRDFDYLTRLWDEIREKTLASQAPALIHEDSGLIKRAIRDVYNREIDQVLVEGRAGFEAAHRFMSMLMPSHAAKVMEYEGSVPLFQRFGVEDQLEAMYQPVVQLKSGGYLVINPTEALVSIDINSGRSTREYGIEETATKTNLEAADEIGRQLRLRDMAGLVVIDFIDMENGSNVRKVEKAMKEALKNDRARVQIGRISSFGLMEMSRQRLRTGILEASTHICPMCEGTGMVRSVSSAALAALRALEAEALRGRHSDLVLRASEEVAVYLLNRKRIELAELEELYGVTIITRPDDSLIGPNFEIDAGGPPPSKKVEMVALPPLVKIVEDGDADEAEDDDGEEGEDRGEERGEDGRRGRGRGRRRRGRDGRGRDKGEERSDDQADAHDDDHGDEHHNDGAADAADEAEGDGAEATDNGETGENGGRRKRRRRGRRGRRGGAERTNGAETDEAAEAAPAAPEPVAEEVAAKPKRSRRKKADDAPVSEEVPEAVVEVAPAPVAEEASTKPKRIRRKKDDAAPESVAAPEPVIEPASEPVAEEPAAKPKRSRKKPAEAVAEPVAAAAEEPVAETAEPTAPAAPARKGWWQRTFGND